LNSYIGLEMIVSNPQWSTTSFLFNPLQTIDLEKKRQYVLS
jgi:hypothetical protein